MEIGYSSGLKLSVLSFRDLDTRFALDDDDLA